MRPVELRVLGPLEFRVDGRRVALTAKQRALLATLVIEANRVVSIDRLASEIWGGSPPLSVASRVRTLVADVRKELGAIGEKVIITSHSGYLLDADHADLDVHAFLGLTAEADRARSEGRAEAAIGLLDEALGLWRGAPLMDLQGPLAASEAQRLLEARRAAVETRAEIKLANGQHHEVIAEMTGLIAEHPLWERSHALLMLALHGCGRPAEALQTYRDLHSRFVQELGIEPSSQLQELHMKLLADEVTPGTAEWKTRTRPWRRVCLLPADIGDFVGRKTEIQQIGTALEERAVTPAIVAISGYPGVGKTTLALHVAHRSRPAFPDGQLFARLHGASAKPREPAEVLAELLRSLGVDGTHIPDDPEERAALFRDRVADREVLLMLDDARDEAQVEPLLPGTPSCGVLITSRGPLSGLPGVRLVALDVPTEDEAGDLLRAMAGQERIDNEPQAVREILQMCGRLPLAVRIAGARLAVRPSWPVGRLAARLGGDSTRLDELVVRRMDLRASIQSSYVTLAAPARRAFRLIGAAGMDSVADWSIAALLDVAPWETDCGIEALVAAGLLTSHELDAAGQPRYRCHDLIRDFAVEITDETASRQELREAMTRLALASVARVRAATREMPLAAIPMGPAAVPRSEPSPADRLWLSAERHNLTATVLSAAAMGEVHTAADLLAWMAPFLLARGHHDDAFRLLDAVHEAAVQAGDVAIGMRMRLLKADFVDDHGGSLEALPEFQRLLAFFEEAGDRHSAEYARAGMGGCMIAAGDYGAAMDLTCQALAGFHALEDRNGLLRAHLAITGIHLELGNYDRAITECRSALTLLPDEADGIHRAGFLRAMGIAKFETGQAEAALADYEESLRLSRELEWGRGVRTALRRIGETYSVLGEFDRAVATLSAGLELFVCAGDRFGQALTALALGEVHHRRGDDRTALRHFIDSENLLDPQAWPVWRSRALKAIARSHSVLGNHTEARAAQAQAAALQQSQ